MRPVYALYLRLTSDHRPLVFYEGKRTNSPDRMARDEEWCHRGQFNVALSTFLTERMFVRRTRFGQFEEFICSQLACNEMQASARTCGRRAADSMIENVG